mmetsp:Transcript_20970/g.83601  ORF Transcript_20970/g.83601 Transcript_20970/m.83601 type:complete len:222 (+) Transcript_20970:1601-2266(+)
MLVRNEASRARSYVRAGCSLTAGCGGRRDPSGAFWAAGVHSSRDRVPSTSVSTTACVFASTSRAAYETSCFHAASLTLVVTCDVVSRPRVRSAVPPKIDGPVVFVSVATVTLGPSTARSRSSTNTHVSRHSNLSRGSRRSLLTVAASSFARRSASRSPPPKPASSTIPVASTASPVARSASANLSSYAWLHSSARTGRIVRSRSARLRAITASSFCRNASS